MKPILQIILLILLHTNTIEECRFECNIQLLLLL